MSTHPWLADRTAKFDSSGIRKVFDLAAKMTDPINLSIGQPDFAVPDAVKEAAIAAIRGDKNGYSVTQGIPELREAPAASSRRAVQTCGSPRAHHFGHQRCTGPRRAGADQSRRRGDRVRSILRDVPGARGHGRRPVCDGRHVSRLSHRPGARGRRDHAAHENDPAQQSCQSHRGSGQRERSAGAGRAGGEAQHCLGERRDLPRVLLRRSAGVSRDVE